MEEIYAAGLDTGAEAVRSGGLSLTAFRFSDNRETGVRGLISQQRVGVAARTKLASSHVSPPGASFEPRRDQSVN
jgi:hypothetical protein